MCVDLALTHVFTLTHKQNRASNLSVDVDMSRDAMRNMTLTLTIAHHRTITRIHKRVYTLTRAATLSMYTMFTLPRTVTLVLTRTADMHIANPPATSANTRSRTITCKCPPM